MEFLKVLTLRGPNYWSRRTVLEAWVDLQDLRDSPSNTLPGLYERLTAWMPTLIEHRCGVGERGGFLMRLRDGTYAGHILEHVTIELQNLSGGGPLGFGKARETTTPGIYKVAVRYREEQLAHACLRTGRELLLAAIHDRPFDLPGALKALREIADDVCLGPSSNSILAAAEARNIPARRLNTGSLVQLGHGCKQRRIWTAETDRTGAIAEWVAKDKALTKSLLKSVGVPIPEGRLVEDAEDAWEAAQEVGLPVVVKPKDGNHGRAVFTDLSSKDEVTKAYAAALQEGTGVLVESFAPGNEHRALVVGHKVVAVARGEPAYVVGDGKHTIWELIELQLNSDPRRGVTDETPLSLVEVDAVARLDLERQGYRPESVPEDGVRVLIQRNGNVAFDVTDKVHPEVADRLVLAARTVGLDIAGIDLVTPDISRPLEEQRGAIVEVNAGPGLHMHLMPADGKPRPVGEAIVDCLFPDGGNGRIPTVGVTGTNGKTVVTRLIAHVLGRTGRTVGMACSDGVYVGARLLTRNCSAAEGARRLLLNPAVEAGVFEAGRGSILNEGLGFDKCDVAVVTNLAGADHLGQHDINTPEDMVTVKRTPVDMVMPTGVAVLNAGDPLVAGMAGLSAGGVIYFGLDPEHPVLAAQRAEGKRSVTVRGGLVVLSEGGTETPLLPVAEVPLTQGGKAPFQVENALAAVAALWHLGVARAAMVAGLLSFAREPAEALGRLAVVRAHGMTVVVDRARNTAALTALEPVLEGLGSGARTAVYAAGDNSRDQDLAVQGAHLGRCFDRVVLTDAVPAPSRPAADLRGILRRSMQSGPRLKEVLEVPVQEAAVARALEAGTPGETVVIQASDATASTVWDLVKAWAAAANSRKEAS